MKLRDTPRVWTFTQVPASSLRVSKACKDLTKSKNWRFLFCCLKKQNLPSFKGFEHKLSLRGYRTFWDISSMEGSHAYPGLTKPRAVRQDPGVWVWLRPALMTPEVQLGARTLNAGGPGPPVMLTFRPILGRSQGTRIYRINREQGQPPWQVQ